MVSGTGQRLLIRLQTPPAKSDVVFEDRIEPQFPALALPSGSLAF